MYPVQIKPNTSGDRYDSGCRRRGPYIEDSTASQHCLYGYAEAEATVTSKGDSDPENRASRPQVLFRKSDPFLISYISYGRLAVSGVNSHSIMDTVHPHREAFLYDQNEVRSER